MAVLTNSETNHINFNVFLRKRLKNQKFAFRNSFIRIEFYYLFMIGYCTCLVT